MGSGISAAGFYVKKVKGGKERIMGERVKSETERGEREIERERERERYYLDGF